MASKSIHIDICGKEVPILVSRIKKREIKEFVDKIAGKADDFVTTFTKLGSGEADISTFICGNLDFVCDEVLKPFTSLSAEQMDNMDVYDIVDLAKQWLDYNGINTNAIQSFLKQSIFTNFFPAEGADHPQAGTPDFGGIPLPPLRN